MCIKKFNEISFVLVDAVLHIVPRQFLGMSDQFWKEFDEYKQEEIFVSCWLDFEPCRSKDIQAMKDYKQVCNKEEEDIDVPSWMDFEPYRTGYKKIMKQINQRNK